MTSGYRASISVASSEADVRVWHQRLEYMSEKGIKVMLSKDTTSGLKSIKLAWAGLGHRPVGLNTEFFLYVGLSTGPGPWAAPVRARPV